jgi:hypothetical protein
VAPVKADSIALAEIVLIKYIFIGIGLYSMLRPCTLSNDYSTLRP